MSDIDSLKEKLAKLEASKHLSALLPKSSGWLSRKLLIALAVIAALIIIGRENQSVIIAGIITLGMVYLISQSVVDIANSFSDAWIRVKIIEGLSKDGLTKEEAESVSKSE